jgi:hypothetical protein
VRKREKEKVICNTTSISFATAHASQKQDSARKKNRTVQKKEKGKKEERQVDKQKYKKKKKRERLTQTTDRARAKKEMTDSHLGKEIPERQRKTEKPIKRKRTIKNRIGDTQQRKENEKLHK